MRQIKRNKYRYMKKTIAVIALMSVLIGCSSSTKKEEIKEQKKVFPSDLQGRSGQWVILRKCQQNGLKVPA